MVSIQDGVVIEGPLTEEAGSGEHALAYVSSEGEILGILTVPRTDNHLRLMVRLAKPIDGSAYAFGNEIDESTGNVVTSFYVKVDKTYFE